jgi:hypothetical protein
MSREMLAVVSPDNVEVIRRVRVPLELTDEQAAEFQRVINSMPSEWFCPGNVAMLTQYCRHVIMARRIGQMIEREILKPDSERRVERLISIQRAESNIISKLMTQLRLTPQAVQPRGISVMRTHQAESPWSGLKQIAQNS